MLNMCDIGGFWAINTQGFPPGLAFGDHPTGAAQSPLVCRCSYGTCDGAQYAS